MASKAMKRPEYDGNACLLYDYMVSQGLQEEDVAQLMGVDKEQKELMGEELYNRAPWEPVASWIQHTESIPTYRVPQLCKVLNAPIDACFMRSRILNGQEFSMYGYIVHKEKARTENISSEELIAELKKRGYKVFKEV